MDNKTVFIRTSKGEDEAHSRTMHLPGDIKRALLMVDGAATYGEISKRAAPSLRSGLEVMLQELEKGGYITDKAKAGNLPKMSVPPPKMAVPPRMATPHKTQPADEAAGDLDFMSGFVPTADTGKLNGEAEAHAKHEAEAAKLKAQQEAEAILRKAEQEAARIREEAEREKQRAAAEIHAREEATLRAKEEAEATRLKIEQAAKARLEAEARALQQAEAARKKAEQEAAIAHETAERLARQEREAAKAREEAARRVKEEAEAARLKVEQAVKARLEAEAKALQQAEAAHKKAEQEAAIAHETAERLARQEKEAAKAREEAEERARQEAVKATGAPPAPKPDTFAFDAFQIGEPRPLATQQEADQLAHKAAPAGSTSETKPETFAFGAFHVDEPQPLVKPHKVEQPVQKSTTEPAHAAKREAFSFDTFKIEIPEPSVEPPTKETENPAQRTGDVARAPQHAETGQPVYQEAPPTVASKSDGGVLDPEEIKRATQERIETEKRMEEEALAAKKIAEAQAKALAEAEERKAEAARAEIEKASKQAKLSLDTAHVAHAAKSAPVARARRKPFSLGRLVGFMLKVGMFLLILLAGALLVVPYVLPMRDYMPAVEKLLSAKLHQPVHVGQLSGRILPMPRLELGEIYFGDAKQFQVEQALIDFALTGLLTEAKPIDSIELQGVKVYGSALQNVSAWLQQLAADNQYPVARMVISRGTLDADVVTFTGVEGALDFNKFGEFTKASLRSNDGKYMLDINAALGNKLQVAISVRDSALPLLPSWSFDELTAKGLLSNRDLSISEFDGRIGGGVLKGKASIDWHSGWRAQGSMAANTISMKRLNNLLEGNAEGSARFKMTSVDLAGLAGSAVLEGNFTSKNGLISGMDIVETARMRSREHLPGGRTRFDELSGMFTYADNIIHFKQVEVTSNVLNGVATLEIDKQQISGSINAKLTLQESTKSVELQIGGVTVTPTLRYAP